MITLYHAPQSRSSRIIWLLEELGQPYTIKPVTIFRPMTGTGEPDPAAASGHDGGLALESGSSSGHVSCPPH